MLEDRYVTVPHNARAGVTSDIRHTPVRCLLYEVKRKTDRRSDFASNMSKLQQINFKDFYSVLYSRTKYEITKEWTAAKRESSRRGSFHVTRSVAGVR